MRSVGGVFLLTFFGVLGQLYAVDGSSLKYVGNVSPQESASIDFGSDLATSREIASFGYGVFLDQGCAMQGGRDEVLRVAQMVADEPYEWRPISFDRWALEPDSNDVVEALGRIEAYCPEGANAGAMVVVLSVPTSAMARRYYPYVISESGRLVRPVEPGRPGFLSWVSGSTELELLGFLSEGGTHWAFAVTQPDATWIVAADGSVRVFRETTTAHLVQEDGRVELYVLHVALCAEEAEGGDDCPEKLVLRRASRWEDTILMESPCGLRLAGRIPIERRRMSIAFEELTRPTKRRALELLTGLELEGRVVKPIGSADRGL